MVALIKPSEHKQDSEKIFKHKFGLLNRAEDLVTSPCPTAFRAITWSYARKLVTVISGGVFDLLDPVLERHSFDDLGKAA